MSSASYERGSGDVDVLDVTVGDLLRMAVAEAPDRTALVEGISDAQARRRWTYQELLADAEACARALLKRAEPGSHVAIWASNIPEYVVFQFGAALAGMVMVTLNPAFRRQELVYTLQQSQADLLVAAPGFRGRDTISIAQEALAECSGVKELVNMDDWDGFLASGDPAAVLPEVEPSSAAQIQYTSGTTGFPKGAMLDHRGLANDGRMAGRTAGATPGAVWLALLPMFHVGGCVYACLGTIGLAGTLVTTNFDAELALQLVEEERVTISNPVPTMLIAMMDHPSFKHRDLSSLRYISSGGATVPAVLVKRFEAALGVDFTIVFGQTETSGVVTMTRPADTPEDKANTSGLPLPGVEVRIAEPATLEVLSRGEVGEIQTRGYHTMICYHNDPEATAATLLPDGWLRTGDLGSIDDRGYLAVRGRLKEMVIRGGENVFPREIEDLLLSHPGVLEAVVVGVPHDYYGEVCAAFVCADGEANLTETALVEFLTDTVASYKIPEYWYFVNDLPKTLSGKIQKFKLREEWMKTTKAVHA